MLNTVVMVLLRDRRGVMDERQPLVIPRFSSRIERV